MKHEDVSLNASSVPSDEEVETGFSSRVASESPPIPKWLRGDEEDLSLITMDYQMTARLRFTTLGRREISLLLAVLNYQAAYYGVNFEMYLSMDFLSSVLLGNKGSPWEIKDNLERLTVVTSLEILRNLTDQFITFHDRMRLPEEVLQKLKRGNILMSRREFGSRYSHWKPERYIEIRAVPLNVFLEKTKGSTRYSSYTKGYGEGSPSAHRKKTRFSAELDGTEEVPLKFPLKDIPKYSVLTLLEISKRIKQSGKKL